MRAKTNHVKEEIVYSKVKGYQEIEGKGKVTTFGINCSLKVRKIFRSRRGKSLLLLENISTSESFIDFLIGILVNNRVPPVHAKDVVEDHMEW